MSGPQSVPGLSPLYPIGRGEGGAKSIKNVKALKHQNGER
jgi:hypothetical protein